jgi:glycosyltransferase involved in cell wall biosynthesis
MKVSIVTPSFNQGSFIERTLRSVASQEDVDHEHLVFDGGSSDETIDVLRRFDRPLRWLSEKDAGQASAINRGIRESDGEIIGWLNSDDVYHAGALARVVRFFTDHPNVDVVYGMADHIDRDDRTLEPYPSAEWDLELLRQRCFICQPALFLRRRVVEQHGLLDESLHYCMDYEYWLRLGRDGVRFAYLREKLAGSRLYDENKTLGARVAVHREINDMQKRLFGTVPDRWLVNYAHAVVGTRMSRASRPRWFAVQVGLLSLASALRWNGRITRAMARMMWSRMRPTGEDA